MNSQKIYYANSNGGVLDFDKSSHTSLFCRSFTLLENLVTDKIHSTDENGILWPMLLKNEAIISKPAKQI